MSDLCRVATLWHWWELNTQPLSYKVEPFPLRHLYRMSRVHAYVTWSDCTDASFLVLFIFQLQCPLSDDRPLPACHDDVMRTYDSPRAPSDDQGTVISGYSKCP